MSRAILTGGRVVQGSAFVRIGRSQRGRRLPWSHYLSRPGVVEAIGRMGPRDVASGFAASSQQSETLNLGAIGSRAMNQVQHASRLDRRTPFRMARTHLRWIVVPTTAAQPVGPPAVWFGVDGESRRTLLIRLDVDLDSDRAARVVELCEDLALHDWLLTALGELIERSQIGAAAPEAVVGKLKPAIDELLHLWMPAARVDRSLLELWESLERRPGFSKQWKAAVDRVRDQVAMATIAMLSSREPKVVCP
jgi:stage V sporulation protein SpoVS